jgi:Ca2+-binding RTX toxin-like protein
MAQFHLTDFNIVSTSASGAQGNSASVNPSASADGTKIAFRSFASNLVPGDTNQVADLFVKNTVTGQIIRANTSSSGAQSNVSPEEFSYLSDDGSRVGFVSSASDLVPGDTNGIQDVFVKDLASGKTMRVNTAADGTQANEVTYDVSLSANGTKAVFTSLATNLVPEDMNGAPDVFLKDLRTGAISLVSASPEGVSGNARSFAASDRAISADGTKVLFNSSATNLLPGDERGLGSVFIKDMKTGELTLVNVAADGSRANGGAGSYGISDDGMKALMLSDATNLVPDAANGEINVFVKDLATGAVLLANSSSDGAAPKLDASTPSMSADGSTVSFLSQDLHLVPDGIFGFYVKHLPTGAILPLPETAWYGDLSADGTTIVFQASDVNLVPGDTNHETDIFTARLSLTTGDTLAGGSGSDVLRGGPGPDILDGGGGSDELFGKAGDDVLKGGTGSDRLSGDAGNDALNGERGDDILIGGAGTDQLHGGLGRDRLFGGNGRDFLHGGADRDHLYGEAGNDILQEDDGDGVLNGGSGNDWLTGGNGLDQLRGGPGDDTFIFRGILAVAANEKESPVGRPDVIEDFDPAGNDQIVIFAASPFVAVLPEGQDFRGSLGDPTGDTDVEVRWERVGDNALVQVDFDLDQKADMEITLLGVQSLSRSDFGWEI